MTRMAPNPVRSPLPHRPRFVAALTLPAIVTVLSGCGCGASPGRPAELSSAPASVSAATVPSLAAGHAPASANTASSDPLDSTPILADPRLTDARLAAGSNDARAEATALQAAMAKFAPRGLEAARWQYLLGTALQAAGDPAGAASAFDAAAAEPTFVLVDYARLQAASQYVALSKLGEARDRLSLIAPDVPISERSALVLADVLDGLGVKNKAVEIWRAHLQGDKPRARWAEVSVSLATWLLSGPKDESRAREVFTLMRRVLVHAPASASASKAQDLERQALAWLPPGERAKLAAIDASTTLDRADEWVAAGHFDDALADATAVWKGIARKDKVGALACRAASLRADVLARDRKKRPQAADAYGDAVAACAKDGPQLVKVLYNGAKTEAMAGRATEAMAWFARIEKEFHDNRLADDARLRTARLVLGMHDEARFVALLSKMPDDYPNGDMLEDGLFELAFHDLRQGKWAEAIPVLERSLQLRPREKDFWTGGRARYFLARAYEATGRAEDASKALSQVVLDHPWSFFAVLALSRLQASSPDRVRALIEQGEAREPDGKLFDGLPGSLQGPAFTRAVELLRLGDPAAAKREIQTIGLASDDDAATWALSTLYARAGAAELSYRLARSLTGKWSSHYPKGMWRAAWELAYPRPYLEVVEREAARSSIPVPLAYGIMREESAFDAEVVSLANAYGLMQLIPATARASAKALGMTIDRADLLRPEVNIALGSRELGRLRGLFPSAPVLAIPSYNAGPGATQRWLTARSGDDFDVWVESIPYEETRGYTRRVVSSTAVYAWLYEPSSAQTVGFVPLVLKM